MFICPSLKYMNFMQEIKILLTVETEIWKRCAKWYSAKPLLSLHITAKNSSTGLKVLDVPFFANNSVNLVEIC